MLVIMLGRARTSLRSVVVRARDDQDSGYDEYEYIDGQMDDESVDVRPPIVQLLISLLEPILSPPQIDLRTTLKRCVSVINITMS